MNISGVLVQAHPEKLQAVSSCLQAMPGVEVHAGSDTGKLVVTIERDSDEETTRTFDAINLMDGVLAALLVYHQQESDPEKEA